jgi:IS30 family transposase
MEYLPDTASRKAAKRRECGRKLSYLEKDDEAMDYVLEKLKVGWSPEQIAGRMETDIGKYLNYESIYQFVYSLEGRKANLRQYLCQGRRIRCKRHGRKKHRGKIPNRVDIVMRPKEVEGRKEFGHWEGDSVVYNRQKECLSTQAERKTRYLILLQPEDRTAAARTSIINERFSGIPALARRTMTFDNGLEFAGHEEMTKALDMPVYFAKPYSSWQRGTNENSNGLVRRYLPRDTDLDSLPKGTIEWVEEQLNNRPRKCLGFQTPAEAFARELMALNVA